MEGTTYTDDPTTLFGQLLSGRHQPGLTGLNPLFLKDPRFDYSTDIRGTTPILINPHTGDSVGFRNFQTNPRFLSDLDQQTVSDDMWAVTRGGHAGTSVGDRASGPFMNLSRLLMGNSSQVTPDMVRSMQEIMLRLREPELRQYHPGLPAYAPTATGTK